jgi:hypothetical protein
VTKHLSDLLFEIHNDDIWRLIHPVSSFWSINRRDSDEMPPFHYAVKSPEILAYEMHDCDLPLRCDDATEKSSFLSKSKTVQELQKQSQVQHILLPTISLACILLAWTMKILSTSRRGGALKENAPQSPIEKLEKSNSTRRLRAGIFSRFRQSSADLSSKRKSCVYVSWKKYEQLSSQPSSPPRYNEGIVLKGNRDDDDVSARNKMLRASSIATAEVTIPTDRSMDTSRESSVCQEGEASFLQATETLIETREVLISTVDGQIETQQQECILVDMHQVNAEDYIHRVLGSEESISTAPDTFGEVVEVDSDSLDSHSPSTDSSPIFSNEDRQIDEIKTPPQGDVIEERSELDGDEASIPFDEEQEEDEEREDDDDEEGDYCSDIDEEVESLRDADKGIALLQSLFLSDLEEDDDESSFADDYSYDEEDIRRSNENTFSSALDMFEEFAAESIYSASVLFLGPPEAPKKRRSEKNQQKTVQKKDVALESSPCDILEQNPTSLILQRSVLSS